MDEMRIASNEEVVCDVDSGEDAGRGDLWLQVVTNKVTLRWGLGILDEQGFGSKKRGSVRKDSLSLLLATLILTTNK